MAFTTSNPRFLMTEKEGIKDTVHADRLSGDIRQHDPFARTSGRFVEADVTINTVQVHETDVAPEAQGSDRPLVVDLDGTLIRGDLLYEALFLHALKSPLQTLAFARFLPRGKAIFKARLADEVMPELLTLPYVEECLELVHRARKQGRTIVLASASDQRYVQAIADHLGLFDEVYGSKDGINLSGAEKSTLLVERFGKGGFDYVANAYVDWPVWENAHKVITVRAPRNLRGKLDQRFVGVEHMAPLPDTMIARCRRHIEALRPHQWLKNILVFVPVLTAHRFDAVIFAEAVIAFVAFSLIASSAYILNDLIDFVHDRNHTRKRFRPFAAGDVPILHGMIMAPCLMLGASTLALVALPLPFFGVVAVYYVVTLAYSYFLKRKVVVDIICLAGLYTTRVVAGAAATALVLSPWLLAFSMFLFLSLAVVKRLTELNDSLKNGRLQPSGRGYVCDDIPLLRAMGVSSGYVSVLVLALYISNPAVASLYNTPVLLWGTCPLLLLWISRMMMIAHRGRMHDDPIVFAVTDRVSVVIGLCVIAFMLAAVWI